MDNFENRLIRCQMKNIALTKAEIFGFPDAIDPEIKESRAIEFTFALFGMTYKIEMKVIWRIFANQTVVFDATGIASFDAVFEKIIHRHEGRIHGLDGLVQISQATHSAISALGHKEMKYTILNGMPISIPQKDRLERELRYLLNAHFDQKG